MVNRFPNILLMKFVTTDHSYLVLFIVSANVIKFVSRLGDPTCKACNYLFRSQNKLIQVYFLVLFCRLKDFVIFFTLLFKGFCYVLVFVLYFVSLFAWDFFIFNLI